MSLPKEPRQKMINIMYLVLTALLALNVSVEILNAFKTVQTSLDNSSKSLENSNDLLFKQLEAKLADPKMDRAKVAKYKDLADQAKKLSEKVYQDLDKWKDTLLKSSGFNPQKNGDSSFNESDIETPTRLFIEHDNGKKLHDELQDLKTQLLNLSTEIGTEFANKLPINLTPPKSQSGNSKEENTWEYSYFHMTPTIAALTMMSKFQNDVKNSENQIVTYCNNQINSVEVIYDQFKPIVGASSTYLMPGEEMSVTAGIGSFSKQANPVITINGHSQPANADGVAIETFKPSGSGSVHIDIEYTKPDGSKDHLQKEIPYTVGQASSATVSLDKEDVFYIGLENPITVGSPTGMDKTSVTGNGCTISGSGPGRKVSVSKEGTCTITVGPSGGATFTPFTHTYRIKRIPEPELKIGSGKPRMPSVEVKNQSFCRADMGPDFIYDVHYSVVSATVYFSGAGFSNVVQTTINGPGLEPLKSYMSRCMPGSVITFDNVKVSGPDGVRIIEGKSFALY